MKLIDEAIASNSSNDFDASKPNFEEKVDKIASEVPDEEWAKLPPNLIENLDYYLYEKEHE